MSPDPFSAAQAAAEVIETRVGRHEVALILGSGWAEVVPLLGDERARLPMTDVPGFPAPKVIGHGGTLHSVVVADTPVLVAAGRAHLYERHPVETVVHGVRAAVLAGCETVMLTNAAGSLNAAHGPGTPVLIADQLNLMGTSPMLGDDPPEGYPARFVDLSDLYSPHLRRVARDTFPGLAEGVYAGMLGGAYETPAEIRMLATLGADLVGMSTVLEAIAARHLGATVFGLSLVTNLAAGLDAAPLDHRDVISTGAASVGRLAEILRAVIVGR